MALTYITRSDGKTISIENIQAEILPLLKMKMDNNASGQPNYIGEAYPGQTSIDSVWRIKKMEYDDGDTLPPTGKVWANGSADFNKVWNDRATYSYS